MLCFFACPSCKIWIFLYNKIGGVWNERYIFLQERRDAQVQSALTEAAFRKETLPC